MWGADLSRCGDNGAGLVRDLTRGAHGLLHGLYHPLVARGLQPHFGKIQWTRSQRMCEALMFCRGKQTTRCLLGYRCGDRCGDT